MNRVQKVLEGANIKLSSVATDILGASGLAILEAIVKGTEEPKVLADMAKGRLRNKRSALEQALRGFVRPHQRMMLQSQLRHLDFLDHEIERVSQEVSERMAPLEDELERLDEIPGIGRRVAEQILAEIGTDMGRFPTANHLASWAGLCPGNNESAGKRKSGRSRHGNKWLHSTLVEAAWSASRTKDTYLSAQHHRITPRRGEKRAVVAVAHTMIVDIYHMLRNSTRYHDLGGNFFKQRAQHFHLNQAVRHIESLGYKVTLQAA